MEKFNYKEKDVKYIKPLVLAYIGDSVYENYIRIYTMKESNGDVSKMYKLTKNYVNSSSQSMIIKEIFESLSEEEQTIVTRARNNKTKSKPKNADIISYKWATGFEALLGYLFLLNNEDRLSDIIKEGVKIVNGR